MGKFFSIPHMPPSGGEGAMGHRGQQKVPMPTLDQMKSRHSEYYANKDKPLTSEFADVGDRFRVGGDVAEVQHVEKNSDGSQDVTVQRSARGNSGTYVAKVVPGEGRRQDIASLKRTFD